jgi:hypothetical protein
MNARDKNENVNSGNARNKAAVAAKNVVAVNKVDDKPDRMGSKTAGGYSRRFACPSPATNGRHFFSR